VYTNDGTSPHPHIQTSKHPTILPQEPNLPGYSRKPLASKLDLKPGHRLLLNGAPDGFESELRPLPEGVTFAAPPARPIDCVLLFSTSAAHLEKAFRQAVTLLPRAGMIWVAWPKKASKVETDLTEDVVRRIGLTAGLVDVKVCAVTDIWSGLKFVRRLKDR